MGDTPRSFAAARSRRDAGTVADLVTDVEICLERAALPLARAEARDLVAALLDQPRFWPSLHGEDAVDPFTRRAALGAATRRVRGAPFAYAVGRAAFRHLTLDVDERVLIPRQETEQLVELVLAETAREHGGMAIDVGTGSGAIALSLASEGTFARVIGTDVSLDALAVARRNADALASLLRCALELRSGAALAPVRDVRARVIVSNPPYIALGEAPTLPAGVRDWEPAAALFGGADGMQVIDAIVREAPNVLEDGGLLALEVDARRSALAAERVASAGDFRDVRVVLDLTGRERYVLARLDR